MGLCGGAAQVLASGEMHLSCLLSPLHRRASASLPQLSFLTLSRSSHCLRNSIPRTFPPHFVPSLRNQWRPRVSCMLKEGNQELKQEQQQPSTVGADLSASQSELPTVVEHVVFFKVKEDPKTEELFKELRALKSLDGISELSASRVLQTLGADYTHVLHSRHLNKAALDAYAGHPSHQAVVKKLAPYVEDRLAVDWEAVPTGLPIEGGHGAARISLIKLVDGLTDEQTSQVFALLEGLRDKFPIIRQISTGKNFSPARAKGFDLGFAAMFDSLEELEQLNGNADLHAELKKSRVAPFLSSFVIVDVDSKYGEIL